MTPVLVLVFLFGAIVGSFLNVVIHRVPREIGLGWTRSRCPRCGVQIAWYDNVPLVSFLVLRGRCRSCRAGISWRYPLVEALTGALFVFCLIRVARLGWEPLAAAFVVSAAFSSVLLAASFIDFEFKILPDVLTLYVGPVVSLIGALAVPAIHGTTLFGEDLALHVKPGLASLAVGVAGLVVGGGIILFIRQAGSFVMRREAMGLGDVKFMAMTGLLLGPGGALWAIAVGLLVGSVLGVAIWIATKNREIPFGPFLAAGCFAALLLRPELEALLDAYVAWAQGLAG